MTFSAVLGRVLDAALERVSVAVPGRVLSYDATTQTADVKPLVRRPALTTDDDWVYESLAVVPSVPVAWPGGGGYFVHAPLAAGDTVLLVCADTDPGLWWESGDESEPQDPTRHDLSFSFAIPMVRARTNPIPNVSENTNLVLGSADGVRAELTDEALEVGGNDDAAALASKLDALLSVLLKWVPQPADGGAVLATALAAAFPAMKAAAALPAPDESLTTGSTKLKVGG